MLLLNLALDSKPKCKQKKVTKWGQTDPFKDIVNNVFVHFGATVSSEDNKLLRRWTITDIGHYLFDDSWSSTNAVCRPVSLHDSRWENLNLCPSVRPYIQPFMHSSTVVS